MKIKPQKEKNNKKLQSTWGKCVSQIQFIRKVKKLKYNFETEERLQWYSNYTIMLFKCLGCICKKESLRRKKTEILKMSWGV